MAGTRYRREPGNLERQARKPMALSFVPIEFFPIGTRPDKTLRHSWREKNAPIQTSDTIRHGTMAIG